MFERGLQRLEIAGIPGALRKATSGAFDIADTFERLAKFGEEVGFGEEGLDEIESGIEGGEVAEGMKNPVAEFARAHRSGRAVENTEEGMLFPGAGIDEVEIELRG